MRAGRVLLLSAVGHAALAAVLSQIVLEGKHVAVVQPPDAEPIDVVFIDPAPPPSASEPSPVDDGAARGPATGRAHVHAAMGIATATTTTTTETTTGSPSASQATASTSDAAAHDSGSTGSHLMRMRGAELGLDPGVAQRIAEGGSHELPGETKVSGRLDHVSGGKAIIYDTVTTVDVEQDGTAHFHDKPDIDLHWKLPIPHLDLEGMRKDLGEQLTEWYADPYASTRYGRSQDLSNINLAVPGACDEWASVACDDPLAPESEKYAREQKKTDGSIAGGNADLSAYLYRKFVGDPYASRKLKLLDDTRDERAKMGSEHRAQQLARSAELVERNLSRLAQAHLTPLELKTALFELWDECAEPDSSDEASEQVAIGQAGQRARAQVIGWIRKHVPQASPDAFSVDELVKLDLHRKSRQHFTPYD